MIQSMAASGDAWVAQHAIPAPAGHFDALFGRSVPAGAGAARGASKASTAAALAPVWQRFFGEQQELDAAEFQRLSESVARRIRDNGITYNVYAEENGLGRSWSLDLFPLIIDPGVWAHIEAGVHQRAVLLNAIVVDAYGEQRLLRDGVLPPALVFGHPGYLRAMHGYRPPGDVWLPVMAFDMSCDAEGNWWVVSQRTQAPSGLGYLLENRLIVSAQFPRAFEALNVQRVASTYRALMEGLMVRSSAGRDARVVLLTPGPFNETYFEQAYLARYLGIDLVEGADLTVRDNQLFRKTLRGLERVDIVLRRLNDDFCDPLELRPDSALGVPGLLQAMRAGNVLVANALGSSFLESPGVLGFLPPLATTLLGEALQLPSLATWWCGEAAVRESMYEQLTASIIKPTYPHHSFEPIAGHRLDEAGIASLKQRIEADPPAFTVQKYLPLLHTPVWCNGRIAPRACLLRVFAIHDGQDWQVLPGGLARIAAEGKLSVSMQRGGSSVDTWVMTDGKVDRSSLLATTLTEHDVAARRRPVPSLAAEHLFWMGRYAERAENAVRVARLALEWLNGEFVLTPAVAQWLAVLCQEHSLIRETVPSPELAPRMFERALIAALGGSSKCPSVCASLDALARSAYPIRERLPAEHWDLIVDAGAKFRELLPLAARDLQVPLALRALETLDTRLVAITGSQTDRMTRDDGWRLLSIGRQLERLATLSDLLGSAVERGLLADEAAFAFVLAGFDSGITYRSLYQRRHELLPMLDLLMFDTDNPRSLTWVLQTMRGRIAKLCSNAPMVAEQLLTSLPNPKTWSLVELAAGGVRPSTSGELAARDALANVLRDCKHAAWSLSDLIGQQFFTHAHDQHRQVM